MDFQGSIDDIQFVEIPPDNDLLDDGLSRKDLQFGGKYIHCMRHQLFPNGKNEGGAVRLAFVLISKENDKKKIK